MEDKHSGGSRFQQEFKQMTTRKAKIYEDGAITKDRSPVEEVSVEEAVKFGVRGYW